MWKCGPLVWSDHLEMTVDFRSSPPTLPSVTFFNNQSVSAVETFRFLGASISQDLKWPPNVDSQQRLHFLRQFRMFNLPQELLIQSYMEIVQSVLCTSIIVWFKLPTILVLYSSRVRKRAGNISADPSHPGHNLLELLPPQAGAAEHCTPKQAVTGMNTRSIAQCQ